MYIYKKGGNVMCLRSKKLIIFLMLIVLICASLEIAVFAKKSELAIAMLTARTEKLSWDIAKLIKEKIEKGTNGEITVNLLGPEVGGEREILEGTSRNEYQVVQSGDMCIAYYAPKYAATSVPYVFPDYSYVYKAYEGKLGEKINESLMENGNMRLVGLQKRGARLLTANKPVYSLADLKGAKLRVPQVKTWVEVWKELGALPTPIAWPEVFTSLQTNVIDMQENPAAQIYEAKLYEVQKYVIMTEHLCAYFHWLVNEDYLQQLSPEYRKIVLDAVKEATDWGSKQQDENIAKLFVELQKDYGMQVIIPNKYEFFEAAKPAINRIMKEQWAPEMKEYLEEVLGK
jgi:tripartite ATP-independent transporter DctP family solute receptor